MRDKKLPYLQFYVRDWLASPTRQFMTKPARAAYLDLLFYCWDSGEARLPADVEQLRALASCTSEEWQEFGAQILQNFEPCGDGFITNARIKSLWNERKSFVKSKKRAADSRWKRNAHAVHMECLASVSASASSSATNTTTKPTPKPSFALPDWVPSGPWLCFVQMRIKKRNAMTERAMELAVKNLEKLRSLGHDPGVVLDNSTFHGWQGLFAPRESQIGKPELVPAWKKREEDESQKRQESVHRLYGGSNGSR